MVESVLEKIRMKCQKVFHTIHNYIDTDEMILRKSTIAAHAGEKVLIPINMEVYGGGKRQSRILHPARTGFP